MNQGIIDYARAELIRAGYDNDADRHVMDNVMQLLTAWAAQGHNSGRGNVIIEMFWRLASQQPIAPLFGTDDEWQNVGDGLQQNIRCPQVYKDINGQAYDAEAILFEYPDGYRVVNADSRRDIIAFPYSPRSMVVRLDQPLHHKTPAVLPDLQTPYTAEDAAELSKEIGL